MLKVRNIEAKDLSVSVPSHLRLFGGEVKARIAGNPAGPLIIALGGISANRFVAVDPHGDPGWWAGLIGPDAAIDLDIYQVLGVDFAADETGAAAPSTEEQAEILLAALDAAGAAKATLLGASYGGMVAMRFAECWPERTHKLIAISAPARPDPAATAIRELQRRVVRLGIDAGRGCEGLAIARGMAMLTYRTADEFAGRFQGGIGTSDPLCASEPGEYLRARGEAYRDVMSPERFLSLSASIDRHEANPANISATTLIIGALTDQLVPPRQLEALSKALPDGRLHILDCLYGHDMFLKEADKVGALIADFLEAE